MVNPHLDNGKPWGGSSKSAVSNPYKQAAQSMMSAGISSLSGATTSDDKGKKAKQIQKEYQKDRQDKDKGDGLLSPSPTKKEVPIKLRKKEKPTRFHKRKLEKKIDPVEKPDYLQPSLLSFPQQDTFGVLNNESFQEKTNNFIDAYVPQSFQNTLGVSYTLASAAVTGDINLEKQITDKSSLSFKVNDWGKDVSLIFNLQLGG